MPSEIVSTNESESVTPFDVTSALDGDIVYYMCVADNGFAVNKGVLKGDNLYNEGV
jgi:hypothetical protein